MYWFSKATIPKVPKLSALKQQKFIVSQFWRLKAWNQGVHRAIFFLISLGENTSLTPPSWYLLAILDIPWLVHISLQSHGCLLLWEWGKEKHASTPGETGSSLLWIFCLFWFFFFCGYLFLSFWILKKQFLNIFKFL